jgi:plastocyanin
MLTFAAIAGCSAPVREQAKSPGQNTRGVSRSKPIQADQVKKAVIRGTLASTSRAISLDEAVVFVVDAPKSSERPARVAVGQTSSAFSPRVAMVAVGDTVVFVNRDQIYHSVFSISPARRFEIGSYGPGVRRSVAFGRQGNVRVFCDMHSTAKSGYIYVVPTRVAARPNPAGKFALPPLPPGRYRVQVWHPELGEHQWTVDLPEKGVTKELRL